MDECACGCGGLTWRIWLPGHDVRAIRRGTVAKLTAGWPSEEIVDACGCRTLIVQCLNSVLVWSEQPNHRGQWLGRVAVDGTVINGYQLTCTAEIDEATSEWAEFYSKMPGAF
jgi:hypothetical protein